MMALSRSPSTVSTTASTNTSKAVSSARSQCLLFKEDDQKTLYAMSMQLKAEISSMLEDDISSPREAVATYTLGQRVEVLRSTGEWEPAVVTAELSTSSASKPKDYLQVKYDSGSGRKHVHQNSLATRLRPAQANLELNSLDGDQLFAHLVDLDQGTEGIDEQIEKHMRGLRKSDVSLRYHAAEALADLGPKALRARVALEKNLRRDPHALVRKSAALALGFIGCEDSRQVLAEVAEKDEDQFVRQRAEDALRKLNVKVLKKAGVSARRADQTTSV